MEGRKHAELELHRVAGRRDEGSEVVIFVFGDFDLESLELLGTAIVHRRMGCTYDILLDAVDGRVILRSSEARVELLARTFIQIVEQLSDLQDTRFLECPRRHFLREFAIRRLHDLAVERRFLGEPTVHEKLSCADNGQAGRVVGLHCRDNGKLLARRERFFDDISLVLRVVAVCGARSTEDGLDERRLVAKCLSHRARNRNDALAREVILEIRLQRLGKWK